MPLVVERFPDGPHPAVHHVAGGHDVGPGVGVGQGLAAQHIHRFVVDDGAVGGHYAVVAVAVVGVEGHIGHHHRVGMGRLDSPDGLGDEPVGVPSLVAGRGLEFFGGGFEENHRPNPQISGPPYLAYQAVKAPAIYPGHRVDGLVGAPVHEQRQDEMGRAQLGLAHHVPDPRGAPIAPRPGSELQMRMGHALMLPSLLPSRTAGGLNKGHAHRVVDRNLG